MHLVYETDESRSFKPCPFCGKPPRHLPFQAGFWSERVICDGCDFHLSPEAWEVRSNAKVSGAGTASAGLPGYAGDNNGEK